MFALARTRAWESFVVMGALGFGVGTFSAAMPGVILAVTPPGETSSAMSFNQVVRSVGFSVGSALSGFILSAYTPPRPGVPGCRRLQRRRVGRSGGDGGHPRRHRRAGRSPAAGELLEELQRHYGPEYADRRY